MKFIIKDIPIGTVAEITYQFLAYMKLEGVQEFQKIYYDGFENWYMLAGSGTRADGCIYHISWLEKQPDDEQCDLGYKYAEG